MFFVYIKKNAEMFLASSSIQKARYTLPQPGSTALHSVDVFIGASTAI